MKKKIISIITAILLVCGAAAVSLSVFAGDEKSTDAVQPEKSVTETPKSEDSEQEEAVTGADNSVPEDTSDSVTEVPENSNNTQTEEPSQEDRDNEAEIPENWGE